MKVAILISGQPRNFRQGYEELKRAYLDRYECDIFLHTWKDTAFTATQFFHDRPVNQYNLDVGWETELLDLYKPINAIFDPPKTFDTNNITDPVWRQPLQNTKSMFYSIQQAFNLTNVGYDVYIRTRFDLRYEKSTLELASFDLNKLYLWNWDTDPRVRGRGYYDVFAIGSYDTIGIYSNVFPRLDWYLNYDVLYKQFLEGDSGLRNEYLLRWHLTNSGVPVTITPTHIPHADGQIIR
jgi:hypothetical protein